MRRKLIQHGMSSLTVSLPSKWAKANGLRKGEEIEVTESGTNLIISAKKHYSHRKIELDISDAGPMIRRIVASAFKSGYDEINVRFSSFEELKAVQDLAREQFSGFEVIDQTKDGVVLKNLAENNFEEFPNVLRRFFLVLNQIAEESSQAIEKDDFKWMKNISLMKIESDKFADYCRRAINMGCETNPKRSAPLYTMIEQLEKSVDRYADLCNYISEEKLKSSKELKDVNKELATLEMKIYESFYKFEMEKMVEIGKMKAELQKKIDKLYLGCSKKELKAVSLLDKILNLIFDVNGPLMAIYI